MAKNEKEYGVLGLTVTDRFGDEGLVGAAIIRKAPDVWNIDSFLMSCRVIGRGVETAFLSKIVTIAKNDGASNLIGEYIPTEKNQQTNHFYGDNGFELCQKQENLTKWRLDLTTRSVKPPEWVQISDG